MIKRASHIDLYVFISVIGLMMFSIGAVYSASIAVSDVKHGDYTFLFRSHAIRVVIGVAALFVGMLIDYHVYKKLSKILLVVALILLAYTIFNGVSIKGAQRWISLGPIQFQPSEYAKYALIVHLAVLLSLKQEYVRDFKYGFMPLMIWIVAVVVLVLLQPNFSTGAILLLISMLLLFVGRVKIQHMIATAAAGLPLLIIYAISAPYRWSRIMAYIPGTNGDYSSADAAKYQTNQAIIGLGSGGIFGVGMGLSKQRELFLPESYTDFIFAIIGEEYGLVGSLLVMAVFTIIMIRGMKIAKHAADDLGRYLALGITITITIYALINAMVTTGLLPTTGLPMPLISYGGTSIIFTAYAFGILINVSKYTRLRPLQPSENDGTTAPIAGEVF
jgi:cell division protein FtsW